MSEQGEPFSDRRVRQSRRRLTAAARRVRDEGFRALDALTPCPVEGIDGALDLKKSPVRWPMLIAEIGVAAFAYGLESWSDDLRLSDRLGRKAAQQLADLPAGAFRSRRARCGSCGIRRLLVLCGLPRLNHPLFDWDRIERATDDRYFLLMAAPEDEQADTRLRALLLDAQGAADRGGAGMRAALLLLLSLASAGCTDQSMTRQPHYGTNDPAPAFANGSAAQPLPEGTVSQGDKEYDQASRCSPAGRHGAARARQGAVRDLLRSLPRL